SELTPLPTTTASKSLNCDLPELVVGDEAALLRAERLHLREHVRTPVLRQVDAALFRLDPDRVEPALLAEHDAPRRSHELRRVRLDRRRIVELGGDGARLAAEERLAGDRLP